jgi:two-component system sensor histidine kinase YesM
MDLSKRQMQYQALQNQINPHFLYNTLEGIRSEALLSGLESVAQMCESLAEFFRYTISNMEDLVTLEEELRNVETYFYIQRYRFGERLHLCVEYDENDKPQLKKSLIPKLTLQPIVENALIHGIEAKAGDGTVTIKMVLTEKRVLITVSDDGAGMDAERLLQVNRQIQARAVGGKGRGGIAIGNVNNRIKIMFGEAYGLSFYSTAGVGTDVEITIPRAAEGESALLRQGEGTT